MQQATPTRHLSNGQIKTFQRRLLDDKQQLLAVEKDVVDIGDNRLEITEATPNNRDERSETDEVEVNVHLEQHILDGVARIDAALHRIENHQYGTCNDCSEPIPFERLDALPAAVRCLQCKTNYEKSQQA